MPRRPPVPAPTNSSKCAKAPDRCRRLRQRPPWPRRWPSSRPRSAALDAPAGSLMERTMPAITASMVGALRAKTDAPMMECKKALTEADGDMDRAEEILRVKLGSKAGKAASRITAEGVIAASATSTAGALVEVNCETDFVSKNDDFLAFANAVAELVAASDPADVAALSALPLAQAGFGPTVEDVRKGLIGKIGENITVRRFKRYGGGAKLARYLHGTRIGVLV